MNHLTDEQLSAYLDDALPTGQRAAADAHLAGCDACRARLAELSVLDESLGRALTHDPGDAYFADFAERVAKKIAAGDAPVAPKVSIFSPRGLAFAGSTAALLLVAGLAWMRFHNEDDAARALRASLPSARSEHAVSPQLSTNGAAPPAVEQSAPPPAASVPAPSQPSAGLRAVRVPTAQPQASGGAANDRLDERDAAGAPAPAAVAGSKLAQMKRRAVQPAGEAPSASLAKDEASPGVAEESAKKEKAPRTEEELQTKTSMTRATPPAVPQPAAQNLAPPAAPQIETQSSATRAAPVQPQALAQSKTADTARGQVMQDWAAGKSNFIGRDEIERMRGHKQLAPYSTVSPCGIVRDSRGHPLAGAEITALQRGVRTTRSGKDGTFCFDMLKAGDTLTVMHVGFDPYTVVVNPMTILAIALQPVGTLGPQSTMLTAKGQPPASLSGALQKHAFDEKAAPAPDLFEGQSPGVRALVEEARAADTIAKRDRTVESYETAAKAWADVALQVHGAPALEARFRYLTALREAYHLAPTDERGARLRSGMAAFVATAPASLPERATVQRWQAEMSAPSDR